MGKIYDKKKLDLEIALIKINAMSVDDFLINLNKYKIDNNMENYIFDLAKAVMEDVNNTLRRSLNELQQKRT